MDIKKYALTQEEKMQILHPVTDKEVRYKLIMMFNSYEQLMKDSLSVREFKDRKNYEVLREIADELEEKYLNE